MIMGQMIIMAVRNESYLNTKWYMEEGGTIRAVFTCEAIYIILEIVFI